MNTTQRGFTLVELMIAVAIVAILAAIALPSYREQIAKSRRADAQAVLLQASQFMERWYTEHNRYDFARDGTTAVSLPANLSRAPQDGTKYYEISLDTGANAVARNAYTLKAVPVTGAAMENDKCGSMTLNNQSTKGVTGTAGVDTCWRR
jgi:type IV pilus assembly protein PilE